MQDAETTPWYPTARLLRQQSQGDWDGVIDRVIRELDALHRSPEKISSQAAVASELSLHCIYD